jgi:hypothetical protein
MHARTIGQDMVKKNNYPGAGTYELMNSPNLNHRKSASFKIGTESRKRDPLMKE